MNKKAWIGPVAVVCTALLFLGGCSDFESENCGSDWQCRTEFGVGYTCNADSGYCVAPKIPGEATDVPGDCTSQDFNYPADIFSSSSDSTRGSLTLGVIFDHEGKQVARAARVAMEVAKINGGLRGNSLIGTSKFTVVACQLTPAESHAAQSVQSVARFLRDDVGAQAVLLGLNSRAVDWASGILSVQDDLTAAPASTLIITANAGSIHIDGEMRATPNLWTMAASQEEMLTHNGAQLLLRRLQPYAAHAWAHRNDDADSAIDSVDDLLNKALDGYVTAVNDATPSDNGDPGPAQFIVQSVLLARDSPTSGGSVSKRRQIALQTGVQQAFLKIRQESAGNKLETADRKAFEDLQVLYGEQLLTCQDNCNGKTKSGEDNKVLVQEAIEQTLRCDQITTDDDGNVNIACEDGADIGKSDFKTKTMAVMLQTESSNLVDAFYDAIVHDNDIANAIGLENDALQHPSSRGPNDVYTTFMMPARASSGATTLYLNPWGKADASANGRTLWFEYVRRGRILGVRQSADKSLGAEPYEQFDAAQNILIRDAFGSSAHYITQAYDAAWLAMVAITDDVVNNDDTLASFKKEPALIQWLYDNATYSTMLRTYFSGADSEELTRLGVTVPQNATVREQDLIPSQWNTLFDAIDEAKQAGRPALYRFRGASGELRFGARPIQDDDAGGEGEDEETVTRKPNEVPYAGKERLSYDYGLWIPQLQTKKVEHEGEFADVSMCLSGATAPIGQVIEDADAHTDEHEFVCPVELRVCRVEADSPKSGVAALCVPTDVLFPADSFPGIEDILVADEKNLDAHDQGQP